MRPTTSRRKRRSKTTPPPPLQGRGRGLGHVLTLMKFHSPPQPLPEEEGLRKVETMNELTNFANPVAKPESFDQIQIGLASPERIRSWSFGEIGRATSELQSLMRISYAVFCLKKTNK